MLTAAANAALPVSAGTLFIAVIALAVLVIILVILLAATMSRMTRLERPVTKFLSGREGKSLEEILVQVVKDMDTVNAVSHETERKMSVMIRRDSDKFSKVGIVRYDAFRGMTGKLSFVVGLLDGRDNGFLINSMHSNEGSHVYLKEILHGESVTALSSEERKALEETLHCEKGE